MRETDGRVLVGYPNTSFVSPGARDGTSDARPERRRGASRDELNIEGKCIPSPAQRCALQGSSPRPCTELTTSTARTMGASLPSRTAQPVHAARPTSDDERNLPTTGTRGRLQ